MAVKGTARDRWKQKDWYEILAPKLFNEAVIGEIPASDPKSLIHRRVEATMFELMGNVRKSHMKVVLGIDSVDGNKARTSVKSFVLMDSYVDSLIRRHASKIDSIVRLKLKDDTIVRVKPFVITLSKADTSQKQKIRIAIMKTLNDVAKEWTFDELLMNVISDKIPKILRDNAAKIYPIKNIEVRRIDTVNPLEKSKRQKKKDKAVKLKMQREAEAAGEEKPEQAKESKPEKEEKKE